jgi:micrococcal nuclease
MYEYRVKSVDRIIDGDTVDVTLDLGFGIFKKERCRIAGIDTPEKRTRDLREKKLGLDATHYAEQWFSEGDIIIRTEKDGKYGRMLAWVYRGDECFNHKIIEDGYALEYHGGTKNDMSLDETLMQMLSKRGYTCWEDYSES